MKNSWVIYVVIAILAIFLGVAIATIVSLSKDNRSLKERVEKQSSLVEEELKALENANKELYFRADSLQSIGDSLEDVLKEKLAIIAKFEENYDETVNHIYSLPIDSAMVFFAREVSSEISARD